MPDTLPADVPPDLRAMLDNIPPVAAVRERIDRNRAEAKFLRRLLKLAADAQAAAPAVPSQDGEGER